MYREHDPDNVVLVRILSADHGDHDVPDVGTRLQEVINGWLTDHAHYVHVINIRPIALGTGTPAVLVTYRSNEERD